MGKSYDELWVIIFFLAPAEHGEWTWVHGESPSGVDY